MLDVVLQELTPDDDNILEFQEPGEAFLVKNFTDADIMVKVDDSEGAVTIPAQSWQLVLINFTGSYPRQLVKTKQIIVTGSGTGNVEAQRIDRAGMPI